MTLLPLAGQSANRGSRSQDYPNGLQMIWEKSRRASDNVMLSGFVLRYNLTNCYSQTKTRFLPLAVSLGSRGGGGAPEEVNDLPQKPSCTYLHRPGTNSAVAAAEL